MKKSLCKIFWFVSEIKKQKMINSAEFVGPVAKMMSNHNTC